MKRLYFSLTTLLLATCSLFATNISKQAVDTVNTLVWGSGVINIGGNNYPVTLKGVVGIKVIYTNDANGNLISREEQMLNSSGSMVPVSKIENTFEFNQVQICIFSEWNTGTKSFDEKKRDVYEYPEVNTQFVYKYTGSSSAGWVLSDSLKKVCALNSNLDTIFIDTYKALSPGIWSLITKEERTYDLSNRIVDAVIQTAAGANVNKLSYEYNDNDNTGNVIIKKGNGSLWEDPAYSFPGATIDSIKHVVKYSIYDVTITSVKNRKNLTVQPYPNPTSEGFYINAGDEVVKVSVFTLSGALILEKEGVTGNEYITSSSLTNGTYLIKIENDKNVYIKKLLVK